jgi:hypothetical protein
VLILSLTIVNHLTFFAEYWQVQNTGYLMSIDLLFLCRLLNAFSAAQKASILQGNICCDRAFLTEALEEDPYDWVYQTDAYAAAEDGQELLLKMIVLSMAQMPPGHGQQIRRWTYCTSKNTSSL